MFVIQFIRQTELQSGADPNDLHWTTMQAEYETEEKAEDDLLWHVIEEPAYSYRVVSR